MGLCMVSGSRNFFGLPFFVLLLAMDMSDIPTSLEFLGFDWLPILVGVPLLAIFLIIISKIGLPNLEAEKKKQ